jgi:hypothetical protein
MRVLVGYDPNNLNELIFCAVSDAISTHFLAALDTCEFAGEPLSTQQISHLFGGLMRGFALAKESAQVIQMNYARMMMAGWAERNRLEEEPPGEEAEVHDLHDPDRISQLFERKPPPDAA